MARSQEWWREIDRLLKRDRAIVYVPDVCIVEAFKVLAKKYYVDKYFTWATQYKAARDRLSRDIRMTPRELQASERHVKFHDIPTSRDIVISVDRFFEVFHRHRLTVQVCDLIVLASAKCLIDFFRVPKGQLYIVTLDNALWQGSKLFPYIPSAFNPNKQGEDAASVFVE